MGKQKLCIGIIIGAIIGGFTALFNKEARDYTKGKCAATKTKTTYFIKNPSEAVRNTRIVINQLNENFANGAKETINALEQVETTLDEVMKKEHHQNFID